MKWWNTALRWVVCATEFCTSGFRSKTENTINFFAQPMPEIQKGVIFSRDDLTRPMDSRPRCSVYLSVSAISHEDKLAMLLKKYSTTTNLHRKHH